jgi:hypothetical protein
MIGQSTETGKIWYARHRTKTNKTKNTTQKNNKDVQSTLDSIALFASAAELCPEKILCWVQALE